MNTCENCIHFDICNENADGNIVELMKEPCFRFMEIVRCEDCVYKDSWYETEEYGVAFYICGCSGMHIVEDNDFCSYGERKEND